MSDCYDDIVTGMEKDIDTIEGQTHVHEFLGSTLLAAPRCQRELLHNHRFAGVSGPVKPTKRSHVHLVSVKTDFFLNHFHTIEVFTGPAVPVYDEKDNMIGHIHALTGETSRDFFHAHEFRATTLIEDPISEIEDADKDKEKDKKERRDDKDKKGRRDVEE